jgi:hypothetical protein
MQSSMCQAILYTHSAKISPALRTEGLCDVLTFDMTQRKLLIRSGGGGAAVVNSALRKRTRF